MDCPPAPATPRGRRTQITTHVKELFHGHNGFAGARTIHQQLRREGIATTLYAVRVIMAQEHLVTKYRRPFKRTTIPDPKAAARTDLLQRDFHAAVPTTHLCGDITYLRTGQGWMYLATVIDLTTRMVVGWQIADRMTSQLVVDALAMAYHAGYVAGNAIFHSDRGSQYTSQHFTRTAARMDVRLSVGETGVCWDNAVAESLFSTLKTPFTVRSETVPNQIRRPVRNRPMARNVLQPETDPLKPPAPSRPMLCANFSPATLQPPQPNPTQ